MNKRSLNPRALFTSAGAAVFSFSIPAYFEWGPAVASIFLPVGYALLMYGQTRRRRRGGRKGH